MKAEQQTQWPQSRVAWNCQTHFLPCPFSKTWCSTIEHVDHESPDYFAGTTPDGALQVTMVSILGDPGADSGGEGKSKRAEKYGTKKSKERREESPGTMSYQTSSKRSPLFWLLIGARKLVFFWHQSEARTAATVWNWSGKTFSPGALLAVLCFSFVPYFSACLDFPSPPLSLPLGLRGCMVSRLFPEDRAQRQKPGIQ